MFSTAAAVLAACIKLINLTMVPRVDYAINPAISIVLEGMIVFVGYKIMEKKLSVNSRLVAMPIVFSIAWRVIYLVYILFMPEWIIQVSPYASTEKLLNFLILETVANAALILSVSFLWNKLTKAHWTVNRFRLIYPNPANINRTGYALIALATPVLAIIVEWTI